MNKLARALAGAIIITSGVLVALYYLINFFSGMPYYEGKSHEYWYEALEDPDPGVRSQAVEAMCAALKHWSKQCRVNGIKGLSLRAVRSAPHELKAAIPALIDALGDQDYYIRERAAYTLGEIGPDAKEAIPALKAVADDENEDKWVRDHVAEALKKIQVSRD